MLPLDDWSAPALARDPAAPAVGPFPGAGFVRAWWEHRGSGRLLLAEADGAALPLWEDGGLVAIAGEEDLTDYHSPLGDPAALRPLGEVLAGRLPPGARFRFDSLPAEAAEPLADGLADGGVATLSTRHEAAAVVALDEGYDGWLGGLRGKDRHEVRRKGRRFAEVLGDPALVHGRDGFDEFVRMHRLAGGRKGRFMDGGMEGFFRALLDVPGAVVSVLEGGGRPAAAAFGFEDGGAYYLYNSGYDPELAAASPGVVLVERLIARAAGAGRTRFDFLKGDEAYKFRMGASARPLYALEGTA
ncbi:MAG: GNAT family N-acetyltransferase [Actinobacteria bacterium]|nr:GNAT family N-acetyltransferase [Actinomycetota bacterium]